LGVRACVRTLALEKITAHDFVSSEYEVALAPSFLADLIPADTPAGNISAVARKWWNEQGAKINWHPSYGLCDP